MALFIQPTKDLTYEPKAQSPVNVMMMQQGFNPAQQADEDNVHRIVSLEAVLRNDFKNKKEDYKAKYKTELCKNWMVKGECRFGAGCAFAHGHHELRKKANLPGNYRTKMCKTFHEKGYCQYGSRCQFMHDVRLAKTDINMKKGTPSNSYTALLAENNKEVSNELVTKMATGVDDASATRKLIRPRLAFFEQLTQSC